jgi:hypothetical protein
MIDWRRWKEATAESVSSSMDGMEFTGVMRKSRRFGNREKSIGLSSSFGVVGQCTESMYIQMKINAHSDIHVEKLDRLARKSFPGDTRVVADRERPEMGEIEWTQCPAIHPKVIGQRVRMGKRHLE